MCLQLSACGEATPETQSSAVLMRASPVLVTLGGFNSCAVSREGPTPRGTERWDRAMQIVTRSGRSDTRWAHACFDRSSRLYWVSSAQSDRVASTSLDELSSFFDSVSALTAGGQRPLYVTGHSYGGWLAMYLVWYLPTRSDIALLATVDPISPAHCAVSSYLWALALPWTAASSLAGCQRAPSDFTVQDRQYLLSRVRAGGWRHYYQRNFWPLRSGPYSDSAPPSRSYDMSPFLTRSGAHPSFNAHLGIAELSSIWYSIEASMLNDYAE